MSLKPSVRTLSVCVWSCTSTRVYFGEPVGLLVSVSECLRSEAGLWSLPASAQSPALSPTSCVTLDKFLNLSELQFRTSSQCFVIITWGLLESELPVVFWVLCLLYGAVGLL